MTPFHATQKAKSKVRMMSCEMKMEQDRCCWCNYKLSLKKQQKQTTKKVLPNRFWCFQVKLRVLLMFRRPKDRIKGKCYLFSGYKMRNNVWVMNLECKLNQDSYGWWTFKLICQKTIETTYLETRKKQTKYRWCS